MRGIEVILLRMRRVSPVVWICLLWFMLVVPAILIRGAHYEEGTTIGLARGAFEDGHWLTPFRYGVRFAERPVLVSWLLGAVGMVTGELPLWLARIPMVLSLLGGALLIHGLVRSHASRGAATFGAICFLISPMMLQKLVTAEVDGVVSVLLFAAFVLWWNGRGPDGPKVLRWLAISSILAIASLVKGPQPVGFFFLGVGVFLAVKRRWREGLALLMAGMLPAVVSLGWYYAVRQPGDLASWIQHSRIGAFPEPGMYLVERTDFVLKLMLMWLPGTLLAVAAVRGLLSGAWKGDRELVTALLFYGGVCSMVLIFWPHAGARYAMPGVLAIAAVAGLAFDGLPASQEKLIKIARLIAGVFIAYAVVLSWVIMPLNPVIFHKRRSHAQGIMRAMEGSSTMLFVTREALDTQVLVDVARPVRQVSFGALKSAKAPFFAIVTPKQAERLRLEKGEAFVRMLFDLPHAGATHFIEVRTQ